MSENLKVNANSSVLEHKRKHNLLVDGLQNGDVEIPNAKPLYWHNIRFEKHKEDDYSFILQGIIINNSNTPLTRTDMFELIKVEGFVMLAVSGVCGATTGFSMDKHLAQLRRIDDATFYLDYYGTNGEITSVYTSIANTQFIDLGVNKLN